MLELAILGALKERPMHGYELKKRLTYLLGHLWKISFGSLYPALKRLESKGAVEKAYTIKEKTRNRYVYRITPEGEDVFRQLLVDTRKNSEITDTDKFSLRLAFFQYMEPEMRLWLLEKRRNYLDERLQEMESLSKPRYRDSDRYRQGLYRHRQELLQSDITWLNGLIEQERERIQESLIEGKAAKKEKAAKKGKAGKKESGGGDKRAIEDAPVENITPIQA